VPGELRQVAPEVMGELTARNFEAAFPRLKPA
jgi:hypothetical protein